ncbi:hypothetical protein EXIGLDRAFT_347975 [Exidia glandulosa HHB12029]|uniref:RRM domain-containing protein n=1 Tax=Exidia glandulosa HHB12029 TaxID=1314781 RepID=A0A166B472_EXIGL|nr:hypothetical protein EXIGLDRAFT_347975 [Exidia glandulosa HHB12029]
MMPCTVTYPTVSILLCMLECRSAVDVSKRLKNALRSPNPALRPLASSLFTASMDLYTRVVDVSKAGGRYSAPEVRSVFSKFCGVRAVYPWKSFEDDNDHAFVEFTSTVTVEQCSRMASATSFRVLPLRDREALRTRFEALLSAGHGRPISTFNLPRQPRKNHYDYRQYEHDRRSPPSHAAIKAPSSKNLKATKRSLGNERDPHITSTIGSQSSSSRTNDVTSASTTSPATSFSSSQSAAAASHLITLPAESPRACAPPVATSTYSNLTSAVTPAAHSLVLHDPANHTLLNLGNGSALRLGSLPDDAQPAIDILVKSLASTGAFLVVARQYKIRSMLDQAHLVAQAALKSVLSRGDRDAARPVYLFISTLHTARAPSKYPGDTSANAHMLEAAKYINLAHNVNISSSPDVTSETCAASSAPSTDLQVVCRKPDMRALALPSPVQARSVAPLPRALPSSELVSVSSIISSMASGNVLQEQSAELERLRRAKRQLEADIVDERSVRRRLEHRVETLEDDLWHARRSLERDAAHASEIPALLEMAGNLLKRAAAVPLADKRV